jgi:hypothetical protein
MVSLVDNMHNQRPLMYQWKEFDDAKAQMEKTWIRFDKAFC